MSSKIATKFKELKTLLSGNPPGTVYNIRGYVNEGGTARDLTVRTLPEDGYSKMKAASLEILNGLGTAVPAVPGFEPSMIKDAIEALKKSYSAEPKTGYTDPITAAVGGGYGTGKEPDAIYLQRLETMDETATPSPTDTRRDATRAKAALVQALKLPVGRYLHCVKLTSDKFSSIRIV